MIMTLRLKIMKKEKARREKHKPCKNYNYYCFQYVNYTFIYYKHVVHRNEAILARTWS